jgi:ribosomal protein S18 acetylase RimI-like enzyme
MEAKLVPTLRIVIRQCGPEEIDAVLSLWRDADATPSVTDTRESLNAALDRAIVLVADNSGAVVGSAIGGFDGWRGNIYRVAVHPAHRRCGIARALVGEIERRLVDRGARRLTALVETDHAWATGFWKAVSYTLDSRISRFVRNVERNRSLARDAQKDARA